MMQPSALHQTMSVIRLNIRANVLLKLITRSRTYFTRLCVFRMKPYRELRLQEYLPQQSTTELHEVPHCPMQRYIYSAIALQRRIDIADSPIDATLMFNK